MEDKLFPKTNSLLDGRVQPLADIDEFALKIKVSRGAVSFGQKCCITVSHYTYLSVFEGHMGD